jgi:hypothetical protein
MEKETHKSESGQVEQVEKTDKASIVERIGLIDGLPVSYNTDYVISNKKICMSCMKYIKQKQIDRNEIVFCSEKFDFYHKKCLEKNGIQIVHQKPHDKSSLVTLIYPTEETSEKV